MTPHVWRALADRLLIPYSTPHNTQAALLAKEAILDRLGAAPAGRVNDATLVALKVSDDGTSFGTFDILDTRSKRDQFNAAYATRAAAHTLIFSDSDYQLLGHPRGESSPMPAHRTVGSRHASAVIFNIRCRTRVDAINMLRAISDLSRLLTEDEDATHSICSMSFAVYESNDNISSSLATISTSGRGAYDLYIEGLCRSSVQRVLSTDVVRTGIHGMPREDLLCGIRRRPACHAHLHGLYQERP